jgi:hypothetical protein
VKAHKASLLVGVGVITPGAVTAAMTARYYVDVPYWDQWSFVPLLDRFFVGSVPWAGLWAQHNEHRLFFPRLLMLILARATRWNIGWELATIFLLAVALFLLLAFASWQALHSYRLLARQAALVCLSMLIFSLAQWENWLWGWQIQIFLNLVCAALALTLLALPRLGWKRLAGAGALATVAAFSFANGMAVWAVGILPIFGHKARSRRVKLAQALTWLAMGLGCGSAYLKGYVSPAGHPSPLTFISRPLEWVEYTLIYLGQPLASVSALSAFFCGALGVASLTVLLATAIKTAALGRWPILWVLSLSGYAVASALMSGVGRLGFGVSQALSTRYVSIANLFWISVALLGLAVGYGGGSPWQRFMGMAATAWVVIAVVTCSAFSVKFFRERSVWLQTGRDALIAAELAPPNQELLLHLYPSVPELLARAEVLRRWQLSLFRP